MSEGSKNIEKRHQMRSHHRQLGESTKAKEPLELHNPRFALSLMKSAEAAAFPCVDQECPIERQLVKSNRGNISFAVLP